MNTSFRHYLALGDSISIDRYPGLDVAEREGLASPPSGLGAASLLHENDDDRWPEFRGRDLLTLFPGITWTDLAQDGATTWTVLKGQLRLIPESIQEPALVTVTAGGNDLLALVNSSPRRGSHPQHEGRQLVEDVAGNLERIMEHLRDRLPHSKLVVGTVYDPSDGTGDLGDGRERPGALKALHTFNRRVEEIAASADADIAPIHDHFLGHGFTETDPRERWYWRHLPIEPSARGASEVRRLWWKIVRHGSQKRPHQDV